MCTFLKWVQKKIEMNEFMKWKPWAVQYSDHLAFTLLSNKSCTYFELDEFFLSPKKVHLKALLYLKNSNWKKILWFRNMREKLEIVIFKEHSWCFQIICDLIYELIHCELFHHYCQKICIKNCTSKLIKEGGVLSFQKVGIAFKYASWVKDYFFFGTKLPWMSMLTRAVETGGTGG